jgi:PAS domain S-box-containing protein
MSNDTGDKTIRPVRILLLEDTASDAELIEMTLAEAGMDFSSRRVETREAFARALDEFSADIILSDFRLPSFDGRTALAMVQKRCPATPMLMVTGAIGDELAVELLKSGARDYILKDRLARLPSAVHRALAEAEQIRQRQAAEKALRESEAKFRAMSASAQDAMILVDADARICFWNAAAERIFGYPKDEALGKDLFALAAPERLATRYRANFNRFRDAGTGPFAGNTVEISGRRRDGADFPLEVSISALILDDRWHAIGIARDISERKQAEEELSQHRNNLEHLVERRTTELAQLNQSLREANRQLADAHSQLQEAERMAAVGQLAAGVAHEINNPIAFVGANLNSLKNYFDQVLELLQQQPARETPLTGSRHDGVNLLEIEADAGALVAESRDGLARVKRIIQDLRAFASVGARDWQRVDLHRGLESAISLLHGRIAKVDIVRDYGSLPEIECLPSEINLVFMNLLLNAAESITDHGTITIRTRAEDDGVRIEVTDTGCGINKDDLTRIFDPFFTTKEGGRSLGLGLSLSYGIVQRHRGRIEVVSTPGTGSTFRLWLPCHQNSQPHEDASAALAK